LGTVLASKSDAVLGRRLIRANMKWTERSAKEGSWVSNSHSRPSDN
jgi:hypothetical protein